MLMINLTDEELLGLMASLSNALKSQQIVNIKLNKDLLHIQEKHNAVVVEVRKLQSAVKALYLMSKEPASTVLQ